MVFINQKNERVEGILSDILDRYTGKYSLKEISKGLQELKAPIGTNYLISPTSPGEDYLQETDTFDTWFSSAQWPYTTLMTNKATDFKRFYPTSVMETGYDILPFWVMRMLMMGIHKTNQVPFKDVYLHGLVRDAKGQKMSKSKGNVVNPLEIIDRYGADSLRMALVIRSSAGLDKSIGDGDFKAARNLTNKLWNAARFILLTKEQKSEGELDKKFNAKLQQLIKQINQQLKDFKIGLAGETLYNEFWHWFCDECIEAAKQNKISQPILLKGLVTFLKLLHPFMPFITEAIWQALHQEKLEILKKENNILALSNWPEPS